MEVEWSNEMAIRLIQEYKERPELWDPKHEHYRVHATKYEAWDSLARVFDCDIADLRKKLNSLLASHRREKAKVRTGGCSTWFLYKDMKFLPTHLDHSRTPNVDVYTNQQEVSSHGEELSSDDDHREDTIIIKQEPMPEIQKLKAEKLVYKNKTQNVRTRPIKKQIAKNNANIQLDTRLLETLKLLKKSDLSRKKDECDSFGEYIAVSLRKHDYRTQSMIKQAINNILFEQEMKKYNTTGEYVVISSIDENPLLVHDDDDDK